MQKTSTKTFNNSIDRLDHEIEILDHYVLQIDKYYKIITNFYIELTEYNSKFLSPKIKQLSKKNDPLYIIGVCLTNVIQKQISILDSLHKTNKNIFEPLQKSLEQIRKKRSENPEKFDIKYNTSDSGVQIKPIYDELIKLYRDTENKIIDDYIQKKYNRKMAGLDPSIKLEGANNIIESVRCLEGTFAGFKDYKKQNLADGIKYSNEYSKEIITSSANSVKNYFDIMKNNYINLLTQIETESKNIDDLLKSDFLKNLSSDLITDEFGYFKYNIKVIAQNKIRIIPKENDPNDNNIILTEEDVYNIVKKIYDYDFKMINKTYNLEEEFRNLKVIQLTNKLLDYGEGEKEPETTMPKDDIDSLYELMNDYKHLSAFFMVLNNYRSAGKYEMPKSVFDVTTNIFLKAFEYLTKNDDRKFTSLLIVLSQTFFNIDNGEKVFLQSKLKNVPLFNSVDFWSKLIEGVIQDELEKAKKDEERLGITVSEERRRTKTSELVFLKITPFIYNMKDYDVDKEKINEIIKPLIEKYIITNETKEIIISLINN